MFDTMGYGFRRELIAVWDGEQFELRDSFIVTNLITNDVIVNLLPEHPYYNNNRAHVATSWSIGAAYDPVRHSIMYGTIEAFLRPGGTPAAELHLQHNLAILSHRLYNVAQRVDHERRALRNEFAQCAKKFLIEDAIDYILRFC